VFKLPESVAFVYEHEFAVDFSTYPDPSVSYASITLFGEDSDSEVGTAHLKKKKLIA
jgi:hypothetical protein